MCWKYMGIYASNIPKMKITAVSQWTARLTYKGSPKNAVVYLEISLLDCLTTKKIPELFYEFYKISAKVQVFPGLF